MEYKIKISKMLNPHIDLEEESIRKLIEIPPNSKMGDYTLPCFQLVNIIKKSPNIIAQELKNNIESKEFEKIENCGPYLNFFIRRGYLIKNIVEGILCEGNNYGKSNIGKGKIICVEYSSPNIGEHFHVGHLFSAVIGNSLYNILKSQGYNAVELNRVGDLEYQFGKMICAYEKWGDEEQLRKGPNDELLRLYSKFHEEAKRDLSLETAAHKIYKNLSDDSSREKIIWNELKDYSLNEFREIYDILDIKFDSLDKEVFFNEKMSAIVEELRKLGLLIKTNEAEIVSLEEYNMPPIIILRNKNETIYENKDIAVAIDRQNEYKFYKYLYVSGIAQNLHFRQIFKLLELLGHKWAEDCIHVSLGLIKFSGTDIVNRDGTIILLKNMLRESIKRTSIVAKNKEEINNKRDIEKIALGALKFIFLRNLRNRDVICNWNELLDESQDTAYFMQYTHRKGSNLLIKFGECNECAYYDLLSSDEEFELVKRLEEFNKYIVLALEKMEPSILTAYLIEISQSAYLYFDSELLLNIEDEKLKAAKINIIKSILQVLKNGLDLLGISVL